MKKLVFLCVLLSIVLSLDISFAQQYGTFIEVIEKAEGSFDEVSAEVEKALQSAGWNILAAYDSGVPEGCAFRARVIVFSSDGYAASIMKHGPRAAFALPLRAAVYEDESGIHVSVVNPSSINRTIIGDQWAGDAAANIVSAISSAVKGNAVNRQIGQLRSKGRVGGMGGGDFNDKIETIYETGDTSEVSFRKVVEAVRKGIEQNRIGWKLVYAYDLPGHDAFVLGTSGGSMEGKAFRIAGEKRASSSHRFPGLDHAAAFPIEVVVYREDGRLKVVTLDEMYRMKLYFEDAGMWAFMKNMRMPGRIEDRIKVMASSMLDK